MQFLELFIKKKFFSLSFESVSTFVYLVSDVENGDVRVDFDHIFVVR